MWPSLSPLLIPLFFPSLLFILYLEADILSLSTYLLLQLFLKFFLPCEGFSLNILFQSNIGITHLLVVSVI